MGVQDIAILLAVGVSTLYGLSRGGVKEIFGVLAIVAGVAGGVYLHGPVGEALGGSGIARIVGFLGIFLIAAFVVHKIGSVIRTSMKLMLLGGIDRLIGAVVGFFRGALIACVALGLMALYVDGSNVWMEDSKLALPVLRAVGLLSPLFPQELRDRFGERYEQVKVYWEEVGKKGGEGVEMMRELGEKVRRD